jgi:hypothetical protein
LISRKNGAEMWDCLIPCVDPALPLTDDELLAKHRECGRSRLRSDDIERSVGLVLDIEAAAKIGTPMAILSSPLGEAQDSDEPNPRISSLGTADRVWRPNRRGRFPGKPSKSASPEGGRCGQENASR